MPQIAPRPGKLAYGKRQHPAELEEKLLFPLLDIRFLKEPVPRLRVCFIWKMYSGCQTLLCTGERSDCEGCIVVVY